ncbi:hypothetical protein D9547_00010 [Geobacillus stearothermophilus]|uniref:Uncharacterized protein n=1 Tax=Geobacillus stearothermophilus TaxID=1422 RepID=A0A3L7DFZ8_GEOSE|nr:hypothetical protein D9549_01350 [Geobacillus stearothermophilus]RLQ12387.1 hypothetical protein D9547_00010 [Geobacillus stearothermophilus]RLQ15213.1 hypothetical protein D9548_00010 [Geobacillus stearothermophilus]
MPITIIAGRESFFHDICFFYRASLGGPDERREQKFATLVGDHFGMSPTNILLTPQEPFLSRGTQSVLLFLFFLAKCEKKRNRLQVSRASSGISCKGT